MTKPAASGLCYKCKYQKDLTWSAHSECTYSESHGVDKINALWMHMRGLVGDSVVGSEHGIKNGWFMWPVNFDPVWLEKCDFFHDKEDSSAEHPAGNGTV